MRESPARTMPSVLHGLRIVQVGGPRGILLAQCLCLWIGSPVDKPEAVWTITPNGDGTAAISPSIDWPGHFHETFARAPIGYVDFGLRDGAFPAVVSAQNEEAPMATETPTDTLELRGPLPEDFPGYAALVDAGVDTYGKVRKQKNLADIAGIGPVTAEKITLALAGGPQNAVEAPADTPLRPAVAEPSTNFEAPASPVKVVCPECGVGGELAGDALVGTATCGNPDHPETVLVRAT